MLQVHSSQLCCAFLPPCQSLPNLGNLYCLLQLLPQIFLLFTYQILEHTCFFKLLCMFTSCLFLSLYCKLFLLDLDSLLRLEPCRQDQSLSWDQQCPTQESHETGPHLKNPHNPVTMCRCLSETRFVFGWSFKLIGSEIAAATSLCESGCF